MRAVRRFIVRFVIGFIASITLFVGYGFLIWLILMFAQYFGVLGGIFVLGLIVSLILTILSFFLSKR